MNKFRRRRLLPLAAAVLGICVFALGACSGGGSSSAPATASGGTSGGFHGDVINPPVRLSDAARTASFRSTSGGSTTLGALQQGHLMLLYFGYTHCPDVCPTTMADLGTALRELPSVEQAHVQVVFVTSDPARDTPPVMKSWLSNFDRSLPVPFTGLTASLPQIDSVAKSMGVPLSPPKKQADGSITVQHGAQTLAFVGGTAKVLWLAGTNPGDYAHDLRKLVGSLSPA